MRSWLSVRSTDPQLREGTAAGKAQVGSGQPCTCKRMRPSRRAGRTTDGTVYSTVFAYARHYPLSPLAP